MQIIGNNRYKIGQYLGSLTAILSERECRNVNDLFSVALAIAHGI